MNFFEHQEKARRKTSVLVFYFFLALVLIILCVDALIVAAIVFTKSDYQRLMPTYQIKELFITTSQIVIPIVTFIVFSTSAITWFRLRGGGLALAEMVKARPIDTQTNNFLEKRFLNIVEEMSIASGVAIPKVFVMDNEPGINAFVAGIKPEDTVMVATRGALQSLNRDELQGVIGHEYSHILNSDMIINLRLIAILAGILVISQAGYNAFRLLDTSMDSRNSKSSGFAIVFVGIGLIVIGSIGLFFGRLIKAAISRQRELLADASSVAYTRNPEGLVNALRRIEQDQNPTLLKSTHAEDISHLCIAPSTPIIFFKSLLATHPPLEARIKLLDPDGIYSSHPLPPLSKEKEASVVKKTKATMAFEALLAGAVILSDGSVPANKIHTTIGKLTEEHLAYAKALINEIPDNLLDYAHNPQNVDYLLWALVLPKDKDKAIDVLKASKAILTADDIKTILMLHTQLLALNNAVYLTLLDLCVPTFKQKPKAKRQAIFDQLNKAASFENQNLFEFVLLAIIGKAVAEPKPVTRKEPYKHYSEVLPELSGLLSLLVSFTQDTQIQNQQFQKAMRHFTQQPLSAQEQVPIFDANSLTKILDVLNNLSPFSKEKVILAAIDCIESDNKISLEEAELIRGIAACLDCPIPPFLPK